MTINYALYPNHLNQEGHYLAKVQHHGTADQDRLIEQMLRQGSSFSRGDIAGLLILLEQAMEDLLLDGYRLNLPFLQMNLAIQGNFKDEADRFYTHRHQVVVKARAGKVLAERIQRKGDPRKQKANYPAPKPSRLLDYTTEKRNTQVTPHGVAHIWGKRLRFDEKDPEQGVFFYNVAEQSEVRVTLVIQNSLNELIFKVPALPAGMYEVRVKAQLRQTQAVREGILSSTIEVLA